MEKVFNWRQEKNKDNFKFIAIYFEDKLFGKLPNLDLDSYSVINSKYFQLETVRKLFSEKNYIVDTKTKSRLYEIVRYSDASYHLEKDSKSFYLLTKSWYYNNDPKISFGFDKVFSRKSGKVAVSSDTDIELLVFSAFCVEKLNVPD